MLSFGPMSRFRRVVCLLFGFALWIGALIAFQFMHPAETTLTSIRLASATLPLLGGGAILIWTAFFPNTRL